MKIISNTLREKADDIDAGNSNLSEEEQYAVIDLMTHLATKNDRMSKDQACSYLNVSRATFDNYVRNGDIPRGKKQRGFKELSWNKLDLDKFVNRLARS